MSFDEVLICVAGVVLQENGRNSALVSCLAWRYPQNNRIAALLVGVRKAVDARFALAPICWVGVGAESARVRALRLVLFI
jgi:hypothetical protein